MRLIDADKLKKDLSENYVFYGFRQLLNDFYEALDSAPSIDIVRCKECKKHNTHRCHMAFDLVATNDDDFCSYGEREGK